VLNHLGTYCELEQKLHLEDRRRSPSDLGGYRAAWWPSTQYGSPAWVQGWQDRAYGRHAPHNLAAGIAEDGHERSKQPAGDRTIVSCAANYQCVEVQTEGAGTHDNHGLQYRYEPKNR
jgi:hypothetical protein